MSPKQVVIVSLIASESMRLAVKTHVPDRLLQVGGSIAGLLHDPDEGAKVAM